MDVQKSGSYLSNDFVHDQQISAVFKLFPPTTAMFCVMRQIAKGYHDNIIN